MFNGSGEEITMKSHMLDCEIIGEPSRDEAPIRAQLTLIDPGHHARVNLSDTHKGLWFSEEIGIEYGLWVQALDAWVYKDVFRGPIQGPLARTGEVEIQVDCASWEAQHLPDYVIDKPWTAKKDWLVWKAIRELFQERGVNNFDLAQPHQRVRRSRSWRMGAAPMRIARQLLQGEPDDEPRKDDKGKKGKIKSHIEIDFLTADDKEFLLYFSGAKLTLRERKDDPVFTHSKGETSIVTEPIQETYEANVHDTHIAIGSKKEKHMAETVTELDEKADVGDGTIKVKSDRNFGVGHKVRIEEGNRKEARTITGIAGSTITLKEDLEHNYPKGTRVTVLHIVTRPRPIVAKGHLPAGHRFSKWRLSGGMRPCVAIIRKRNIDQRDELQKVVDKRVKRAGEVSRSVSITCLPIAGVQLKDVHLVNGLDGIHQKVGIENYSMGLTPDGVLQTNWTGEREPRRNKRQRKKKNRGSRVRQGFR